MDYTFHHGIRVVRSTLPGPFLGVLALRVGTRDETFRTAGVTHVLEHLVCASIPRDHLDFNAQVDDEEMRFHATGEPADVARFLNRAAAALSAPPMEHLERELRILEAEGAGAVPPHLAWAARARYGYVGVGLAGGDDAVPLSRLTADQVLDHARRHIVRDNAVLALSGPIPDELNVHLADGARPRRPASRRSRLPLPARCTTDGDAGVVLLSYEVPHTPELPLLPSIIDRRATELLRHDWGIAYAVEGDMLRVEDRVLTTHVTEVRSQDAARAATGLLGVLRDLAETGPTAEEIAREERIASGFVGRPEYATEELLRAASSVLVDEPYRPFEDRLRALRTVSPAHVRDWARAASSTVLLATAEGTEFDAPGLTDLDAMLPQDAPVEGRTFRRHLLAPGLPRDARVVVGAEGLTCTALGQTVTARWEDVVGVERGGHHRTLVFADGRSYPVVPSAMRGGRRLVETIDARTEAVAFDEVAVPR